MAGSGGEKEKISILCWLVRTRNSLLSSSSRSFRTQSHWSFITGHCHNSWRFLQVHFSCWKCGQFTLHKFRIDTGRTKILKQGKTDGILHSCESHGQGPQRSEQAWLDQSASCMVQAENVEMTPRTRCIGSKYSLLNVKDSTSIKQDVMQSSFTIHSQLVVSRKLLWWNLETSQTRKFLCHLRFIQRFLSEIIDKRIGFRSSWKQQGPNESNENQKPNYQERRDPWPKWRNSTLTSEYQDCHMQLWTKQKISALKSSSKRSKVIIIEKHFKPICSRITSTTHSAKIRRTWSANWAMWRYSICAKLFRKCNVSHCLLYWNQGLVYCACGQFLVESESRRKFHKPRLDALCIPHCVIKKGRCHGARHGKTEEQKEYHIAWNAWKRCCKKVDSQGEHFTCIHDRFFRDQVLNHIFFWLNRAKVHKDGRTGKTKSHVPLCTEEFKRYQGQRYLTSSKSGKNAPMKLRPDFRAAVSLKNSLLRESGEEVAETMSPKQDGTLPQAIHGGTRPKVGGAHDKILKWPLFCYSWFSFTVDGDPL